MREHMIILSIEFCYKSCRIAIYLTEDLVTPPYEADNLYGWAKPMGELTLKAYCQETDIKAASCRYFTAYGPRCLENHAVMAMIARAFIRQRPFEVWGDGKQVRNWTYIDDIVEGTLLAAEKIDDGTAINLQFPAAKNRIKILTFSENFPTLFYNTT